MFRPRLVASFGLMIYMGFFSVPASAAERIVYAFGAAAGDGIGPQAGLIADVNGKGTLYGTTCGGGGNSSSAGGTVYRLIPSGSGYVEQVLLSFGGVSDSTGTCPIAPLAMDGRRRLYGTASYGGGSTNDGATYEGTPQGHGFSWYSAPEQYNSYGGNAPLGGFVVAQHGIVFGTNSSGGACFAGTAFTNLNATPIYAFGCKTGDGAVPAAGVIIGADGALFGTTEYGGSKACKPFGCGIVYKLTQNKSGWSESRLYAFTGGTTDGYLPLASLIRSASGTLFGTTVAGGSGGHGTVFRLKLSGSEYKETILHAFTGGADGGGPVAPLIFVGNVLYGTTSSGGSDGLGTVFKLVPVMGVYQEHIVHNFAGGNDGAGPLGGLLLENNDLFGTTSSGGAHGGGTAFEINL